MYIKMQKIYIWIYSNWFIQYWVCKPRSLKNKTNIKKMPVVDNDEDDEWWCLIWVMKICFEVSSIAQSNNGTSTSSQLRLNNRLMNYDVVLHMNQLSKRKLHFCYGYPTSDCQLLLRIMFLKHLLLISPWKCP